MNTLYLATNLFWLLDMVSIAERGIWEGKMETILVFVIFVVLSFFLAKTYIKNKRTEAHTKILGELGELSWSCPKEALQKLLTIQPHSDLHEVHNIARHYLTVWCADLMTWDPRSLSDALKAKEKFKEEIGEIKKVCKAFDIKVHEISPFDEEKIRDAFLKRHIRLLEQTLEHFPEAGWVKISPGNIFTALVEYADQGYTNNHIEKWRAWIRSAYLRQARRLLRRLRNLRYGSPDEAAQAVDKILILLENAKAEPEEIGTTAADLENLRQHSQYGT